MSRFMKIEDAFEIVFDLAKQGALDESDMTTMDALELQDEMKKQQLALDTVHDFLINNIYN